MNDSSWQMEHYIERLKRLLDRFDRDRFRQVVEHLMSAYRNQANIFVMGNGGSAATASHLAVDLNKGCGFNCDKRFRVICLNDSIPSLLAYANDLAYEAVFVEQLKNFFHPGDVVMGLSASGNSPNVLAAIEWARQRGGITIGLTGYDGGKLAGIAQTAFIAPSTDMQRIEDFHLIVMHMLMQAFHSRLQNMVDS